MLVGIALPPGAGFAAPCTSPQVWTPAGAGDATLKPPAGLTDVVDLQVGKTVAIALRKDGTLAAWGDDGGSGLIAAAKARSNVKALSYGGGDRAGVIHKDGSIAIFGKCVGDFGACTPPAAATKGVVSLASIQGGASFAAVTSDGKLHSWGWGLWDMDGKGNGHTGFVSVWAGGANCFGVKADGTVVGWGNATSLNEIPPGLKAKQLATNGMFAVAVTPEGKAVAWGGFYHNGQVPGDNPAVATVKAGFDKIVQVAALQTAILAVREDGSLVGWGPDVTKQLAALAGYAAAGAVSAYLDVVGAVACSKATCIPDCAGKQCGPDGCGGVCGVCGEGKTCGGGSKDICGTAKDFTALALTCPPGHTISGIKWAEYGEVTGTCPDLKPGKCDASGEIAYMLKACHGLNSCSTNGWWVGLGDPCPNTPKVMGVVATCTDTAKGDQCICKPACADKQCGDDGCGGTCGTCGNGKTCTAAGTCQNKPTLCGKPIALGDKSAQGDPYGLLGFPADLDNVREVRLSESRGVALKHDGTVVAWTTQGGDKVVADAGQKTGGVAIAVGTHVAGIVKADGSVEVWGDCTVTDGNESTDLCKVPQGLTGVVQLAIGQFHVVARKADGSLVAWGIDTGGEVKDADGKSGIAWIGAEPGVTLAIGTDHTAQVWTGLPEAKQVPIGLKARAMSMGGSFLVALTTEGKTAVWGPQDPGALTALTSSQDHLVAVSAGADFIVGLRDDGKLVGWGPDKGKVVDTLTGQQGIVAIAGKGDQKLLVATSCGVACAAVSGVGCCEGDTLKFCDGKTGAIGESACAAGTCGYDTAERMFTCGTDGKAWSGAPFEMACPKPAPPCKPACDGKACGADGCGGVCGTCPAGKTCSGKSVDVCATAQDAQSLTLQCDAGSTITAVKFAEYGKVTGACPDLAKGACDASGEIAYFLKECLGKASCSTSNWHVALGDPCFGQVKTAGVVAVCSDTTTGGTCVCAPACQGKSCGPDGCGGTCGTCANGKVCDEQGACVAPCQPQCAGKSCGPDGCGGSCGACDAGKICDGSGACVVGCKPACGGKSCGPDGCGGSCGACKAGEGCSAGMCVANCQANCVGRVCGDDGCGGSCGTCGPGTTCAVTGACTPACTPSCATQACGDDGCGGSCGACAAGKTCSASGQCVAKCTPACAGKGCGPDGCGGTCGSCSGAQTCDEPSGQCLVCNKDCVGKACTPVSCTSACGSVKASGSNDYGAWFVPKDLSQIQAVRGTVFSTVALGYDGTLTCWGEDYYGLTTGCAKVKDVRSFATGGGHVLALGKDGTVVAWGHNKHGQATVPAGLEGVQAVAAGTYHSVALRKDGTVAAWGRNAGGNVSGVAGAKDIVAIAAGGDHTAGLRKDGTVLVWSADPGLKAVPSGLVARQIAVGGHHVLALRKDGTVVAWAASDTGDKWGQASVPAGLKDVIAIDAGVDFSIALLAGGTVQGWGANNKLHYELLKELKGVTSIGASTDFQTSYAVVCEEACGAVSPTGCCSGATLRRCSPAGNLVETTCASGTCGWNDASGTYGCGTAGASAPGLTPPRLCGGPCTPDCKDKGCGDDGCGGVCGTCTATQACSAGVCKCVPQCAGKACGPDGCGGQCGACGTGLMCDAATAQCKCAPKCAGKSCGPDGCGGQCGACGANQTCDSEGQCQDKCAPQCGGKACGPDGCGGSCGACGAGQLCSAQGACKCAPQCAGKECGPDGCGGICGTCSSPIEGGTKCDPTTSKCKVTDCVSFVPKANPPPASGWFDTFKAFDIQKRQCGPDGLGGICGECPSGKVCAADFTCVDKAQCHATACAKRDCGDDGCGGTCGTCAAGAICGAGGLCTQPQCPKTPSAGCCSGEKLSLCTPDGPETIDCAAQGKYCGWNAAAKQYACTDGPSGVDQSGKYPRTCADAPACVPTCAGKTCGSDGCGGSCGSCKAGDACNFEKGSCYSDPCSLVPAKGCCAGNALFVCDAGGLHKTLCDAPGKNASCTWTGMAYGCGKDLSVSPAGGTPAKACPAGVCVPDCKGKVCGDDGCGGTCGVCGGGEECKAGQCNPACNSKCTDIFWNEATKKADKVVYFCDKYDYFCGKQCACPSGMECSSYEYASFGGKSCVPEPPNECGAIQKQCCDGNVLKWCGKAAGASAKTVQTQDCSASGEHVCGTWDGVNGGCVPAYLANSPENFGVKATMCPGCKPTCDGKTCGPDGCGGSCGSCGKGEVCDSKAGKCIATDGCHGAPLKGCCDGSVLKICHKPAATSKAAVKVTACASGCGWSEKFATYTCASSTVGVTAWGPPEWPAACPCIGKCTGKVCGPDGCGGSCGTCGPGTVCKWGTDCVACTANCAGKVCGDDGCGGTCGSCAANQGCDGGKCVEIPPPPSCDNTSWQGACNGEKLQYCAGGKAWVVDCGAAPKCGWNKAIGAYSCQTDGGADPSGAHPKAATGTPPKCVPKCSGGKNCGPDGCGGTCGTCISEATCTAKGVCALKEEATQSWMMPSWGCCVPKAGGKPAKVRQEVIEGYNYKTVETECPANQDCVLDTVAAVATCGTVDATHLAPDAASTCHDCSCAGKKPCETNTCGSFCGGCDAAKGLVCNFASGECDKNAGTAKCTSDTCGKMDASWPCQCDTGCKERGDCCGNVEVCLATAPAVNACGDGKCGAVNGETCATCAKDCGACKPPSGFGPPWPAPHVQGTVAAGTPWQSQVSLLSPLDSLLPSGAPYPIGGLVAHVSRPGVSAWPPAVVVLGGALKEGGKVTEVEGAIGGGFGLVDGAKPTFGVARVLLDRKLPAPAFAGDARPGGTTLGVFFRVPKDAPDVAVPILSLRATAAESQTLCAWSRDDDARVDITCPEIAGGLTSSAKVVSIRAYYGATAKWAHPTGLCSKMDTFGPTWACHAANATALAEAACLGKSSCSIDMAKAASDPCASGKGPARLMVRVGCAYLEPAQHFALVVDDSKAGGKLRFEDGGPKIASNAAVTRGVWHHAAVTYHPYPPYGPGMRTLFLDGVEQASDPGQFMQEFDEVRLGVAEIAGVKPDAPHLVGKLVATHADLDELQVYDRALGPSEVRALLGRRDDRVLRVWPGGDPERAASSGAFVAGGKLGVIPIGAAHLLDSTGAAPLASSERALRLPAAASWTPAVADGDLSELKRWTLAAWVRVPAPSAGKTLLRLRLADAEQMRLALDSACGGRAVQATSGGSALPDSGECEHGVEKGVWTYVALVQTETTRALYIDGYRAAMQYNTTTKPLFAGAGPNQPRVLELGDGVDLAWAALFGRALSVQEQIAWRSLGPATWLTGARYDAGGTTRLLDYADLHNADGSAHGDRPTLRDASGQALSPGGGAGPLVLGTASGKAAALTLPARGRLRSRHSQGVLTFSWAGRVRISAASSQRLPLVSHDDGGDGRRLFDAELVCDRSSSKVACRVELTALGMGGAWTKWSSTTRAGSLPWGKSSQEFDLGVALAWDGIVPRVAFGTSQLAVVDGKPSLGPDMAAVEVTASLSGPPAKVSTPGVAGRHLRMRAPGSGEARFSSVRLYGRALANLELTRVLAQDCGDLDCTVTGALCSDPGAGALPICGACDGNHLEGASLIGAVCVDRLPFLAACETDLQCQSGYCSAGKRCSTKSKSAACDKACGALNRTCVVKYAGTEAAFTTCSADCVPYHVPSTSGELSLCTWTPVADPGEVCDHNDACRESRLCVPAVEGEYKVKVQWAAPCVAGVCQGYEKAGKGGTPIACDPKYNYDFGQPGAVAGGTCPPVMSAASPNKKTLRCAYADAPDCKAVHRKSIIHKGKGLGGKDAHQCGGCLPDQEKSTGLPLWVERWRLVSPALCAAMFVQASSNWWEVGKPTFAHMYLDLTLKALGTFVLNYPESKALKPSDVGDMIDKGVGSFLIEYASSPSARAQWLSQHKMLSLSDCFTPELGGAVSPFFDPSVNSKVCMPNQFPNGTPCPPEGVDAKLAHDSCRSFFCARDSHVCEEGFGILEEGQYANKADKQKGDSSVGAIDLVQSNSTVSQFKRKPDPSAGDDDPAKREYTIRAKNTHDLHLFWKAHEIFGVSSLMQGKLDEDETSIDSDILLAGFAIPNPPEPASACKGASWKNGEYEPPPDKKCDGKLPNPADFKPSLPSVSVCFPSPGGCEEDPYKGTGLKKFTEKGPMCWKQVTFVGPVPVTIEASVSIDACLGVGAGVDPDSNEPSFGVTPSVGVGLNVKGGVGGSIGFAELFAGVKAAVTIVELAFPVKWALQIIKATDETVTPSAEVANLFILKFVRSVDVELTILKLAISAFVEMSIGWFSIGYEQGLFEFEGITLGWTLDEAELMSRKLDLIHPTAQQ